MRALSIAATGMDAQQTNLEVIANNIANINTTGYKRARAEFSDLLYQTERAQGVPNRANQAIVPEGANIGLGVQTSAVRNLHIQGEPEPNRQRSRRRADRHAACSRSRSPDGETLYTRAGAFNKNADGQLVTIDGYAVVPGITVPQDASEITDQPLRPGHGTPRQRLRIRTKLGQLTIANFVNEAGLEPLGDNLFPADAASGERGRRHAGRSGLRTHQAGIPRSSNVDPVKEITDLISAQRAYEMNSKVIQAADEMAAIVSKNLK